MTSTLTLTCPEGIVLATDMRITKTDPATGEIIDYLDGINKIYHVKKTNIGISYWGLAKLEEELILRHLKNLEDEYLDKDDSVDATAEKLKDYLGSLSSPINDVMVCMLLVSIKKKVMSTQDCAMSFTGVGISPENLLMKIVMKNTTFPTETEFNLTREESILSYSMETILWLTPFSTMLQGLRVIIEF